METTTRTTEDNQGLTAVRYALGTLLLVSAALKGHQLATESALESGLLHSRWFLIAAVEFELLLGLWVWSGLYLHYARLIAALVFAVFAGVSLTNAVSGEASCGCFGTLEVNPWFTFALDVVVLGSLSRWRPRCGSLRSQGIRPIRGSVAALVAAWLVVGVPAGFAMLGHTPSQVWESGEIIGDHLVVLVQPEDWVGKQFPLSQHIESPEHLDQGLWLVLLKKDNCSACREAVADYEALARRFTDNPGTPMIAIIECSSMTSQSNRHEEAPYVAYGRLSHTMRWEVPTPLAVLVDDGMVKTVFDDARDIELLNAIWGG